MTGTFSKNALKQETVVAPNSRSTVSVTTRLKDTSVQNSAVLPYGNETLQIIEP
jgi:LEA14-like dessication related protein